MTASNIVVARDGAILTITMNRPDKKNALNQAMYGAIADALLAAASDDTIRVIVLTGTGDAFTAGNDLGDFASGAPAGGESAVQRFLVALSTAEKPIVAAVNGLAVGVGTTMLLHCDLVYAARSATFSVPFVNLALVPEAASSMLLPRRVGHARAAELFLLGERINAAKAEAIGLVAAVFDDDALMAETLKRARSLAGKAANAVRLTKSLMKRAAEPVADRMGAEAAHFAAQLKSTEFKEAARAFAEKRAPKFD